MLGFVLFGPYDVVKLINSTRTGVFPGLLAAVVVLWPLFMFSKLTNMNKITFDDNGFTIQSSKTIVNVNYNDIDVMKRTLVHLAFIMLIKI